MGKKGAFSSRVIQSAESVKLVRPSRTERSEVYKYLETEEIARLFSVIKSKRDRAIFRLAYHRGLRAHEVGLLQLSDFRDRDGVLFVRRGKGSISREHSLCDEELRSLRSWLKERGTYPGPLFRSRQRNYDENGREIGITRIRLDQLMKKYCKLAGISKDKAHMHSLKHSCGTHLAERGASAAEIQDWLGHRDSGSTDIYMHFSRRRRAAVVEAHRNWI
jgi:integrase